MKEYNISYGPFTKGYFASTKNLTPQHLALGTRNVRLTQTAQAQTRPGHEKQAWSNTSASIARYIPEYGITFHALSTGLFYEKDGSLYDTGLSVVADTEYSMSDWIGDLYLISSLNPLKRIVTLEAQATATAGATTLFISLFEAQRLSLTGQTSGTARFQGVSVTFSAVNTGTGALTVSPLTSSISSGTIGTYAYQPGNTTGQVVAVFGSRLYIGDGNVLRYSAPAPRVNDIANLLDFTTINSAGTILIGSGGTMTALHPTDRILYVFKESEAWYIAFSDIDVTTSAHEPQILSRKYGCANAYAVDELEGYVIFYDSNAQRVIRTKFVTSFQNVQVLPDEQFDSPIREHLRLALVDQLNAHVHYSRRHKLAFVELNGIDVRTTLVFDVEHGVWASVDTGKQFRSIYETEDGMFSTDLNTGDIYLCEIGTLDNGGIIDCQIVLAEYSASAGQVLCDFKRFRVSGFLTFPTVAVFQPKVNGDPVPKIQTWTIKDAGSSGVSTDAVSTQAVASATVREGAEDFKNFGIFPCIAQTFQPIFSCAGDGHSIRIDYGVLRVAVFNDSVQPIQ